MAAEVGRYAGSAGRLRRVAVCLSRARLSAAAMLTTGSRSSLGFLLCRRGGPSDRHSFPTRRSSDLLWEENGLTANLQTFTNGPLQIQALGTGDLDFGYIGPGAMWLPASGQSKVIIVNGVGQADRVIAQPDIESIDDLAGKQRSDEHT